MKILDDGAEEAGAHAFVVELAIDDGHGGAPRELWKTAPDEGDYGGPYARVRVQGGKVETSALRASLQRFNEPPDDGGRWSMEALAVHLLHDLCGVALVGWPCPPNRDVCPHGNAYATDRGTVRWLRGECAHCIDRSGPEMFGIEAYDLADSSQ